MCQIKQSPPVDAFSTKPQLYFFFQKKKFLYNPDLKKFEALHFPFELPFVTFKKSLGFESEKNLVSAKEKFGLNKFDIPVPSFLELMQEHLMAPFFVFQLFCVALWFLDDMWYYSLFTLFMLFVFESTVVVQRMTNLKEFRQMSAKPFGVLVLRKGLWSEIQTDQLLPGDIVSIQRSKEEDTVPCDMLILRGSCIANEAMLSGESTPQLKESIEIKDDEEVLNFETDKNHVLFGGTKVIQVTTPTAQAPPDKGCVAYVLRTGFSTTQGKLVRTMIYSSDRVSANNVEALFFILFLLIFAIAAAYYVWVEGIKDEERKKSKVLLECILIITSVVPPELPMELSLAVNNSLVHLAKYYIFCTEPFRIPFAGKIDVACFDKTGTLTVEDLTVEGVVLNLENEKVLVKPSLVSMETKNVLASAHALAILDDGIIGDPMEKNTLESINYTILKGDGVIPKEMLRDKSRVPKPPIKVIRRFAFSSALKRMSSVVSIVDERGSSSRLMVAMKGAPETVRGFLKSVPSGYDDCYKYWARRGSRVLALGYRYMDESLTINKVNALSRDVVETEMTFAGFLIFSCPLKSDAKESVKALNGSSHRCIMITGDNALTASHVASEVEITTREIFIADVRDDMPSHDPLNPVVTWRSVDDAVTFPFTEKELSNPKLDSRLEVFDLCITGKAFAILSQHPCYEGLLPRIWVYARVSPIQKEQILTLFKNHDYTTLMCGDGTNDVGALKQAHVGLALLNGKEEDMQKINARMLEERKKAVLEQQAALRVRLGLPPLEQPAGTSVATQSQKKTSSLEKKMQDAMLESMAAEIEPPKLKFGDASVAAPFTSKLSAVKSVLQVVKQGRATLVAMTQMYKILALNCLISAYSMSVLYLAGIKQGDWQATVAGLMLTICFFGISKSNAPDTLSKKRPQPNIFNFYIILSVLGQAALHVGCLVFIRAEALRWMDEL
ncbi:hypothetical protein HK098_001354 [Nowakowskiella sp. JEL0407]|nr:hypothetical protein HK098_001354 [Nowakowskiella sp. JEL0407]